jgi:hypothetical protein
MYCHLKAAAGERRFGVCQRALPATSAHLKRATSPAPISEPMRSVVSSLQSMPVDEQWRQGSDNPIVPTPDNPDRLDPQADGSQRWPVWATIREPSLNFGVAVRASRLLGSISPHVQPDVRRVASFS